jgi:hypothetical protein
MWDSTKISNGEPKLVREVVVDRGRAKWVLRASCRAGATGFSVKASKIASSDSLRIGAGLTENWGVFGLQKLGLRRSYVTVL